MSPDKESGIYACSCGALETHVQGNAKAPCSAIIKNKDGSWEKCGKNDSWLLLISTKDLENALKNEDADYFLDICREYQEHIK